MAAESVGQSIEANAYETARISEQTREGIMSQIRDQLGGDNSTVNDVTINVNLPGEDDAVDISSGAGALLLDSALQKLSTLDQASAQILSSKNRSQKEITQAMR